MRQTHMHVLNCILQWKASDNPSEEHDIADLAKELENFNDDQLSMDDLMGYLTYIANA
jgi:hypothetical protein